MARISRAEAEALGLLCKSHLRQERLKPAPGQLSAGEVWFGRGWAPVYDRALCVPLRPYRPASPSFARAGCGARGGKGARRDRALHQLR